MTLHENVARGAAWLDTVRPGWQWDIDPATLNLGNSERCVLGQIGLAVAEENDVTLQFDGYNSIVNRLPAPSCLAVLQAAVPHDGIGWAVVHGFSASGLNINYRTLDDVWIAEIKKRVDL